MLDGTRLSPVGTACLLLNPNSRLEVFISKGLKEYPFCQSVRISFAILPLAENARVHPSSEHWDSGSITDERYALDGDMRTEVIDESRDVHCFNAILSEQDFETVGGASGRDGFRRTMPSAEK